MRILRLLLLRGGIIPQKKGFNMIQTKNLTLKKFQENFDFQNLSFL
ncbi:hypothetical protein [Helicobacter bilis]|nr:hypothetical protein [Helicobacter bilis]